VPVSHLEVQVLEEAGVVHEVQTVVDVVAELLGQDQGVSNELLVVDCGCEVVEGIAGLTSITCT
jgi:hypothetical protein